MSDFKQFHVYSSETTNEYCRTFYAGTSCALTGRLPWYPSIGNGTVPGGRRSIGHAAHNAVTLNECLCATGGTFQAECESPVYKKGVALAR